MAGKSRQVKRWEKRKLKDTGMTVDWQEWLMAIVLGFLFILMMVVFQDCLTGDKSTKYVPGYKNPYRRKSMKLMFPEVKLSAIINKNEIKLGHPAVINGIYRHKTVYILEREQLRSAPPLMLALVNTLNRWMEGKK